MALLTSPTRTNELRTLGSNRIAQVFRYLQALDQLRNPAKRLVREQLWTLWLRDLPHHPTISHADYNDAGLSQATLSASGNGSLDLGLTQSATADEFANGDESLAGEESSSSLAVKPAHVLKAARPVLTPVPAPPPELSQWLLAGWDDPAKAPEVLSQRELPSTHKPAHWERSGIGENVPIPIERFEDDAARPRLLEEWRAEWDTWAEIEKPARQAMRLYERLYELHSQIGRESERLELVLGDGILHWRRVEGGIQHPLLIQQLQLNFDADHHEFTIVETDAPVEFYSALFRGLTDVSGQTIGAIRSEVESGQYHPLEGSATNGLLQRIAARLDVHGEFVGSKLLTTEADHPRISRNPIIFLRTRTLGFATALENILADLTEREDLSNALLGVVGVEPPPPENLATDAPGLGGSFSDGNEDEHVLLSKPANPEQLAIAQRLERHGSVLVQGPPGTGKTHTIANLTGHLLAQGKTVLVTSHTTKALRVLREKVVPTLQPLCVSVLENDGESRQQLEKAVNAIVERLSSSDAHQLEREAQSLAAQRSGLIQRLHAAREQLSQARAGEYRDLVIAGESLSPSNAAREVAAGQDKHNWIPGPVTYAAPLPLSLDELADLYRTNESVSPDDERELAASPPPVGQLLAPDAFDRLVETEAKLRQEDLQLGAELWRDKPSGQTPDILQSLLDRLTAAMEPLREDQPWRLAAIAAGHAGELERETWESLLRLIESVRKQSLEAREALLSHGPVLDQEEPLEEQAQTLAEIAAHLERGGNLGTFTLLTRRAWKKLIESTRVGDKPPTRQEHFQALHQLADLKIARRDLLARWERQMTVLGAPAPSDLGSEPEAACAQFIQPLRECLEWHSTVWTPLEEEVKAQGLDWAAVLNKVPPILLPHADLLRIHRAVQDHAPALITAQINRLWWNHTSRTVSELERRVTAADVSTNNVSTTGSSSQESNAPTSVLRDQLRTAVRERDGVEYRKVYSCLTYLVQRQEILGERRELLKRLSIVAPQWAKAISQRHAPHDGGTLPSDVGAAWRWRQLHDELERRDQASLADLQKSIEAINKELREATAQLIDRRAWAAQVRRTTGPQRKALIGWVQTIRKIGKGTGKRAPRLQAEARRLMNDCRSAVPVWVMPLARVVENFDPRQTHFDVVIIDEASQSDVMGLIAFYLGKQVVVVGDDEQVSPDAVGQRLDEVQHLIDEHLTGIPNANLYDGQFSVYDVALSSFGGTICLREHFRCVPDIIRFSNYLSYNGAIKPLRDASAVVLKPHVVSYRVAAAQTIGKINEAEAQVVASLLIAAAEQPEYAGATFGVIAMVGIEQAAHIDLLLRRHWEPSEMERRQVVCGNAPHFQGDERDVMFISMVDAPKDGPLSFQERPQYRKRLNVAASRARDQVWVVHSLQPETDLKPGDLRRRFLEYAQDPEALERLFEREEAHVESEFERQVLRRLLAAGYRVVPQWKVGSYRIDLVVEGESKRLAVECDGDRYHALDKLPDDMARQAILERLGWTFSRIRGSDFFRNPDRAMEPVFARLKEMEIEPLGELTSPGAMNADIANTDESVSAPGNETELQERIIRRAAELRFEWEGDDEAIDVSDSNEFDDLVTLESSEQKSKIGFTPTLFGRS